MTDVVGEHGGDASMSIEVVFHPKVATRDQLVDLLRRFDFVDVQNCMSFPKGSSHYHWFERHDFKSFDGVEATVFPPSPEEKQKLGGCLWALHTRTRASASVADRARQNEVIRVARKQFGGNFYNDWHGRNRYTPVEADGRDAVARGVYLTYEHVTHNLRSVRFALPEPHPGFEKMIGTPLEAIATSDPTRVLYNALVPFAVAILKHFFGQCFRILLRYDSTFRAKLAKQNRKIELDDVLGIQLGSKTIEDFVASWFSFQSIESIHKAFFDWHGIDVWKILRRRRKVGKKLPVLEERLKELIDFRHGVVHRLNLNLEVSKKEITELLDLATAVIEVFVAHLETSRGTPVREVSKVPGPNKR